MNPAAQTHEQLTQEVADLRARLAEASDVLRAIRTGDVDAVLVQGPQGDQLFTLKGADEPYRVLIEEMNQGAVTLSNTERVLVGLDLRPHDADSFADRNGEKHAR